MNMRIAGLDLPDLSFSRLLRNADRYLAAAVSHGRLTSSPTLSPAKCSFLETDAGVATLVLHRALQTSQVDRQGSTSDLPSPLQKWRDCADVLQRVLLQAGADGCETLTSGDDGECEVLYGRAGLLYALLFLRSSITSDCAGAPADVLSTITGLVSDSNIRRLVNAIIQRGKTGSALYHSEFPRETPPALMWSWHGKRYLGAAHGVGMLLPSASSLLMTSSLPQLVSSIFCCFVP